MVRAGGTLVFAVGVDQTLLSQRLSALYAKRPVGIHAGRPRFVVRRK
jgi:hypothetical protein